MKSVARATAAPASTSLRAGARLAIIRKNETPGSRTAAVSLAASRAMPSSEMAMRCSADTAPTSAASSAPPWETNSSAWILILKPAAVAASTSRRVSSIEKTPGSREDVEELGQAARVRISGMIGVDEEADVVLALVPVLGRDLVGAHEGRDDVDGMERGGVAQRLELFRLVLEVEAVAALRLDRRRAGEEHAVKPLERQGDEVVEAGRPRRFDRGQDAHAPLGQLLVGPALDPQAELPGPVAGEGEVGVGVDEPGQRDHPAPVDRDRARLGLDLGQESVLAAGVNDDALGRGHPAVLDEADLRESPAPPGQGAGAGQELAAAGDDEIS